MGGSAQLKALKSVAGTLRLALNQYRELASFAQFGSDLDKATQQTLNRGERLTAILKQDECDPLPVEMQVVVLYAATNGYLDDVDTDAVMDWERQFRDFMRDSHGGILDDIRSSQKLSDESEGKLKDAIKHFNENYEPQNTRLVDVSVNGSADDSADGSGGADRGATGDQPRGDQLNAAGERS